MSYDDADENRKLNVEYNFVAIEFFINVRNYRLVCIESVIAYQLKPWSVYLLIDSFYLRNNRLNSISQLYFSRKMLKNLETKPAKLICRSTVAGSKSLLLFFAFVVLQIIKILINQF